MAGRTSTRTLIFGCLLGLAAFAAPEAADKLLSGRKVLDSTAAEPNYIRHRCLTPNGNPDGMGSALSKRLKDRGGALAADFDTTIHCLVLRYNFQYETTDDPNTTGRGWMDMSRPLDTETDSQYIARVGHLTDPPPHDSLYFDAHLRALNNYWETVSGGQVHLTWDVYPPSRDAIYELPHPMSYYGKCDFAHVVEGLENYFVDCIRLADTTSPEINFGDYDAFFLFHAGADAQTDLGFPATCSDLFSGYIRFGGEVPVDDSTHFVRDGLMMPETAVQDGRATAMNALLAHEFGHQLGLVDLYSTATFMSQLGDFALMDNNGFGTGVDFGWPAGRVFGAIPLYPCAWSRAYLGFEDVVDFRKDTVGVEIQAAELTTEPGLKIARIPITENEYYLLENRLEEVDGHETYVRADQVTSVILGPVDSALTPTGEYDFLMPGSGLAVYHVDEAVAGLDYDGDGVNNFDDNDLQWWIDERKFVRLIEADGLVQFGGNYRSGYGRPEDLFRDDRLNRFTPATNPPTVDNSGNQTHLYVENIGRPVDGDTGQRDNQWIFFDTDFERSVEGFPIRAGAPALPIAVVSAEAAVIVGDQVAAPLVDDLDGDGTDEIIIAAQQYLTVVNASGDNFIRTLHPCPTCETVYDTVSTSVNRGTSTNPASVYEIPLYSLLPGPILAGPVTGRFNLGSDARLIAVGYQTDIGSGRVGLYGSTDLNGDGFADVIGTPTLMDGYPVALSFGDGVLWSVAIDSGAAYDYEARVYRQTAATLIAPTADIIDLTGRSFLGLCRTDDALIVMLGDSVTAPTEIRYITASAVTSYELDGAYVYGPILVDVNRDGTEELVAFSRDGVGTYLSLDETGGDPVFTTLVTRSTGLEITTDPIAGDFDLDGYPEVVVGGVNSVMAFNNDLLLKTNFPIEVDDRFPQSAVIADPIMVDEESGGGPELVFPNSVGNFYSHGASLSYGFPLSSGEQLRYGSGSPAVKFSDGSDGLFGYLGGDGWFYAWYVDSDTEHDFWPMNGGGPEGRFRFDPAKLPSPAAASSDFDESRYYNYPNPVHDETRIRYYLGADARSVDLDIFDMSGVRITELSGPTAGGTDNELVWDCSDVGTGVYRCVITVVYPEKTHTAFTDIAIVK